MSYADSILLESEGIRMALCAFAQMADDLNMRTLLLEALLTNTDLGDPRAYLNDGLREGYEAVRLGRAIEAELGDTIRNALATVVAFEQHDQCIDAIGMGGVSEVTAQSDKIPYTQHDLDQLEGVVDPKQLAELRSLLAQYQALEAQGLVTEEDKAAVAQAIQLALDAAAKARKGSNGTAATVAEGALVATGGLAVDDATVVGVVNDVIIPFTVATAIVAGVIALTSGDNSNDVSTAIQTVVEATGRLRGIIVEARKAQEKGENHVSLEAKRIAQETGHNPCNILSEMMAQATSSKEKSEIKQAQKFLGCRRSQRKR